MTADLSVLERLRSKWPAPWSWDGRFAMASSAVTGAAIDGARATTEAALPHVFDSSTESKAPEALRALVEACGGLRGNQLAFCDDAVSPTIVGLWWPWGNGGTVSLRVCLVPESDESEASLRAVFAIT